ncbi:alpha/beta fold hydrolase [Raineyella fluvialis]|uniref:Alpha/beta fold hydrolase n=1 Tax=Raineyella fluvialis TaxID=2662261 RepID=A0A5Q2FBG2_9ACTN|nr:alpha/beta hydrolase [Raineyella fluvialis]QGF24129.1 alpha/beta fold hydrolase [Raineyella fluvialis]
MAYVTRPGASAPTPDLPGVDHDWVRVDDITVHVASSGAQGTPVVLLHGFPEHWGEWRQVIGPLSPQHRVICPDLRGAGWTDAARSGYRRRRLTRDVLRLLDALGLERVHLVAHDWSALVAFGLAMEHPERVETLVAMSMPHPYARVTPAMLASAPNTAYQLPLAIPGLGARLLSRGRQPLARYLFGHFSTPGTWTEKDLAIFLAPLTDRDRAATAGPLYRGFIQRELLRVFSGAYRSTPLHPPTLVLVGEHDPVVRADVLARQTGPAGHLEVREVAGAAHFIVDEQPGQVLAQITDFLAAHSGPSTGGISA